MKRLELLDYGRFFAAISVVLYHYTFNGIRNGKITTLTLEPTLVSFTKYGYLGVEFFFMISGYVIFFSALNRTPSQFAVSRALRLFPAYWVGVLFTSFFALAWGTGVMHVTLDQVLANLTMISPVLGYEYVDGVYWTLLYELTFYSGVFALLLLGFQDKLERFVLIWPPVLLLALVFDKTWLPYLGEYYYYFAAGALFAVARNKPGILPYAGLLLVLGLCLYFSVGQAEAAEASRGVTYSGTVVSLIIIIFFLVFTFMNTAAGKQLVLPHSRILGALTYPIYLIHGHFGYMAINRFANDDNKIIVYPILLGTVIFLAWLIHKLVEVRMGDVWKSFFANTLGKAVLVGEGLIRKLRMASQRMVLDR